MSVALYTSQLPRFYHKSGYHEPLIESYFTCRNTANHLQKPILDYVIKGFSSFFRPVANLPTQPPIWHSHAETPLGH